MDVYQLAKRLNPKFKRLIAILNDPAVAPDLRKAALRAALDSIGQSIYSKTYDMTAWDMQIAETIGAGFDPNLSVGLARNVSDSVALGNATTTLDQVNLYATTVGGIAMAQAYQTAGQLGKYRTLQIRLRGKGDCDWCRDKASRGKITNPTGEDFARHRLCDCYFEVRGYMSRNGLLNNYRPRQ